MVTAIDDAKLKDMLKAAVVEALHEHRDLVKDIVAEALEEIALTRAIDEGLRSESVRAKKCSGLFLDLEDDRSFCFGQS